VSPVARRFHVQGTVQGVGFRPFVYRLACERGLRGWVKNTAAGVTIEAEGSPESLDRFLTDLKGQAPPTVATLRVEVEAIASGSFQEAGFQIIESDAGDSVRPSIPPDLALCEECRRELLDPANRRYRYPFINCTHCGPRFSIIEHLPYDRSQTTMASFTMCPRCRDEYEDPSDRRFHAQPNACPDCGPQVQLISREGEILGEEEAAIAGTVSRLREGAIVAVKGLGGFHLCVDAANQSAVEELRRRKQRPHKPLAVMVKDLVTARLICEVSKVEEELLRSPAAPIVLLKQKQSGAIAPPVAPDNPHLGVMLPYTPLHVLLLEALPTLVATSGNLSEEPICIDNEEARERLNKIADVFLVHDRPIVRAVEDSVVCAAAGREMVLRRSRGYAPLPIQVDARSDRRIICYGGHLKNTISVVIDEEIVTGPHLGDLSNARAIEAFEHCEALLKQLYPEGEAERLIVCDAHPDYASTRHAQEQAGQEVPILQVQHHYAHVLSAIAEHGLTGPVLGIVWDGTGYGEDGTIWGGEFLEVTESGFVRRGSLRPFTLPGGEAAIEEPWRSALGLLHELWGNQLEDSDLWEKLGVEGTGRAVLMTMMERGLQCPRTTSAGRLFDGVAALAGWTRTTFEAQAAMQLEFAAAASTDTGQYPFQITEADHWILDWGPLLEAVLSDIRKKEPVEAISARFHNTLVGGMAEMSERIGIDQIVLTGGCFQNRFLLEHSIDSLKKRGLTPFWHRQVPPNDGGISVGQALAAIRHSRILARR
jgi:hydrogenase maturation protein HypF